MISPDLERIHPNDFPKVSSSEQVPHCPKYVIGVGMERHGSTTKESLEAIRPNELPNYGNYMDVENLAMEENMQHLQGKEKAAPVW